MKFEKTEVFNFEGALRGMRNPMNSWSKSDSMKIYWNNQWFIEDKHIQSYFTDFGVNLKIGREDMRLAQRLIESGNEHRKFLRQIMVCVDITAPLYWWKEFDTYKVGTTANSTSTMHKLATTPITLECFEIDDYEDGLKLNFKDEIHKEQQYDLLYAVSDLVDILEQLRQKYLETNDKRYWKELIRWLPESWLQTRTVTMTYENLYSQIGQRQNHKLTEWSKSFLDWTKTLPYASELLYCGRGVKGGENA